jgi:multisubunit Na+/H+ antiporter MnhE subunit
MNQIEELLELSSEQISIPFTILNLVLCFIISMIIRSYYINFSNSLTGKLHIGQIIPILSCVVFLVIVVVKSSLALSLGLVGALSIVRFRTPIKEPEELVYLFLSISIGLGFGAGYPLMTSIIVF